MACSVQEKRARARPASMAMLSNRQAAIPHLLPGLGRRCCHRVRRRRRLSPRAPDPCAICAGICDAPILAALLTHHGYVLVRQHGADVHACRVVQTKNGLSVFFGSLRSRKSTTLAEISSSTVFERSSVSGPGRPSSPAVIRNGKRSKALFRARSERARQFVLITLTGQG